MIKSLKKHADGMAIIIEQSILEQLGVSAGTRFEVATDGKSIILTPLKKPSVKEANEIINERYGEVFRELAK